MRTVLSEYVDYPTWCAPPRHPKGAPPGVVPAFTATNPVKDRGVRATRSRLRGPSSGAAPIQNASAGARVGVTDGWTKKATHHTLFRYKGPGRQVPGPATCARMYLNRPHTKIQRGRPHFRCGSMAAPGGTRQPRGGGERGTCCVKNPLYSIIDTE